MFLTTVSRPAAGVHLWSESVVHDGPVDLMVSPEAGDRIKDQLTRSGASFTININDVQVPELTEVLKSMAHRSKPKGCIIVARSLFMTFQRYRGLSNQTSRSR